MTFFLGSLLSLLGGSALTVLVESPEPQEWIRRPRSRCTSCGRVLRVWELVPVLSYIALRGVCARCRTRIPIWHLFLELAALGAFLLSYALGVRGEALVLLWFQLAVLLALSVIDIRFWVLPDPLVGLFALLGVFASVRIGSVEMIDALLGALVGGLLLGLLAFLTKERAMGWGDVKLAGAMGLALGWPGILLALALAFVSGGTVGALLLATRQATMKSHIPFGPFLALATALFLLWPEIPVVAQNIVSDALVTVGGAWSP